MSERTDRWLTVHAPVALSLIAILASGGVAFGATQSTTVTNKGAINALAEDIDKLEDRLISRLNHQDTRMDKILAILLEGRREAAPAVNDDAQEDATSR